MKKKLLYCVVFLLLLAGFLTYIIAVRPKNATYDPVIRGITSTYAAKYQNPEYDDPKYHK